MAKRVIHRFWVEDFSKLRDGDVFYSFCHKKFIACDPPTKAEVAEIKEKTKDSPECKACLKTKRLIDSRKPAPKDSAGGGSEHG